MKFNAAGDMLATADANNKIMVWSCAAGGAVTLALSEWGAHTSRVTCLDWLACGRRLVSGSLDQMLILWDVDKPKENVKIKEAHKAGVTAIVNCGDKNFASVGSDGFLRVYQLD
jgi:WD40 repeat protein